MGKLMKECHCARLECIQIGVSATQGACCGLLEDGVARGDYRTFGVCIWLVAWLDRLLAFGAIGITDVVDSDGIVIVTAQSYELVKKIVVVLGSVGFALVLSWDK